MLLNEKNSPLTLCGELALLVAEKLKRDYCEMQH